MTVLGDFHSFIFQKFRVTLAKKRASGGIENNSLKSSSQRRVPRRLTLSVIALHRKANLPRYESYWKRKQKRELRASVDLLDLQAKANKVRRTCSTVLAGKFTI